MGDSPETDLHDVLVNFISIIHFELSKIGRVVGGPASDTGIVYYDTSVRGTRLTHAC